MRFKNYRYFAEGLDFHTAFVYNIIVQLNKESCPSWPKEHDWKSCNGDKPFEGSNPLLSAKKKAVTPFGVTAFLFSKGFERA